MLRFTLRTLAICVTLFCIVIGCWLNGYRTGMDDERDKRDREVLRVLLTRKN